ncbi:choline dehydrogenase [Nocardia tenerifensis]|uniref:Choline dehydrogenase n=1 Tax=Nocardia tenerifensis TaxID=228006 RepID=A0A318KC21_9NOCA|nr:GMC family oxidoreductase N-terminal domain-containing protein [Nocardia tenerifensis]PXX71447.1 choline dehydrogenase [Nocardia tenerifensis]
MTDKDFQVDYIVVGAGTAGSVVARRLLDRTDATVLVLEAGQADTNPAIRDPLRMHELWHGAEDWDYFSVAQSHACGRRLHMPRGRVLGGSHALNATIYVRGNPADYDSWAARGDSGWSWRAMEPLFRRIERYDRDDSGVKGTAGMLDVLSDYAVDPIQKAIHAAAEQTGVPANPDYNSGVQDGVGRAQFTLRDGLRQTTADAYLKPALSNSRLTVLTGARVHRVLVRRGRAYGVAGSIDGRAFVASARTEVVLTAGAIDSAALLLRSGIGPAQELRAAGIEPIADLPGVGRNLLDHWLVPVIFGAEREIAHTPGLPHAQTQLFWRSESGLATPDVQPLHFSVPLYEPWMSGPANGFSLMAGLIRPHSVGRLTVAGAHGPTLIDPKVLAAPADLRRLVEAVRLCRQIGAAPALRAWNATERYPGPAVRTDSDLRDYIRRTVITYHHVCGTCALGTGPEAVVDPALRVRAVEGLRIADASVMPTITTGNTNAPTIAIAERAADLMAPAR